jgi:antitoxin YefM
MAAGETASPWRRESVRQLGTGFGLVADLFSAYADVMKTLTVTEVKARLNELVDDAESTHEQIVITKHGRPAAVIVAAEDLESLQETVYWLSQPGFRESIAEAEADIEAGNTVSSDELRNRLGLPPR